MSGYSLRYQVQDVYEAYLREGQPDQQSYQEYLESFYFTHDQSHTAQSREVRCMLEKNMGKDNMRRRLRKKLQQKREAQAKAAEEQMLKKL